MFISFRLFSYRLNSRLNGKTMEKLEFRVFVEKILLFDMRKILLKLSIGNLRSVMPKIFCLSILNKIMRTQIMLNTADARKGGGYTKSHRKCRKK